ncbi:AAA family ATPase [Marivita sp.]|uniref:AAA family ATPase n=1 Tax=Marivita sp. TaxID=2003365 RepID=UPI003F6F1C21
MPRRDPSTFDFPPKEAECGSYDEWAAAGYPVDGDAIRYVPGARVYSKLHGVRGEIQRIDQRGDIYFCADGWPADAATLHERKHLSPVGKPESGVIYPGKLSRVEQLTGAMKPLSGVKPVLSGRYLVKGWLDRGSASVVYGESNVGKTFFALDLAFHVAARLPWHGIKVAGMGDREWPGKVYYLALEGGSGFTNRICAMRQHRSDIFERIESECDFVPWPVTIDLHGATDGDAIASAIEECNEPTALVVIDTLARAMGDGDENTAKDMGQFVRNVDLIRERTGAHVMVIHHSGKDTSKGARGSGSLRGAIDTEIELTRSGAVIMAEARKQREMQCDGVFAYTLQDVFIGNDEDGEPVTSAVVQPTEPVKKTTQLKGQALIAMQAFGDALADHGESKTGEAFPSNRKCVSLDHWREYCDRHSLTDGSDSSAARQAFGRAWKRLQEKEIIRVIDGFAWKCADE